ncbi:DUF948 domain-containing protein [Metabacillus malikii]|uniref:Uncharacterized protein YoxC n=1 Tax=Metabacillus malikii TaxID=1504265 RepID=A0ABT9ZH05_9BACI|nr:DUF948 domain-containing protein [Metabacillus malikii]MDQ0231081.1 uncharacterized protein YoxC [Metabacillus malikii]
MIIILYLSVALIAIAFTILVVYVSKTLKALQGTLTNVANTLEGLEKQMSGVTLETTQLLHKTNILADDIRQKSEKLNSVVDSVQDIGTTIQQLNHSVRNVTTSVTTNLEQNQDKVNQVAQWSNAAIEIWSRWKHKKEIKQRREHSFKEANEHE